MAGFPRVPLAQVMRQDTNYITELEACLYPKLSVKLYGRGVTLDAPTDGSTVKMTRHQLAKPGQVILSEIWAKKGAIGIVPLDGEGALVTSHFFLFDIDEMLLLPRFMYWLLSGNYFADELDAQAHGTTGYAAIRPKQFLSLEIPIPPLVEQQRIVAGIEELARRVEEARGLRREAAEEAEAIVPSALHDFFEVKSDHWQQMPMPDAIAVKDRQVDPKSPEYAQLPHISGENIQSKTCKLLPYRTAEEDGVKSNNYLFSPDTILYSKIRPYLQKAVYVGFQGVCSADIYPIKVVSEKLEPKFVMWGLVAGPFTEYANRLSGRTRMPKLNRKQLFAFTLSYPVRDEQRRIVAYLDGLQAKVDELRRLQAETQKELDALMPSVLAKAFAGEL